MLVQSYEWLLWPDDDDASMNIERKNAITYSGDDAVILQWRGKVELGRSLNFQAPTDAAL